MNPVLNIASILFCYCLCQATACPQSTTEATGQHTLRLCITRPKMAGAYAAFPAEGGGVHFKLERTVGHQSLKYDI